MNKTTMILRHSGGERCNHWLVAICFFLTAFSGLAFFHPAFFWLTSLFGGGTWARILHPFFGVVTSLFFLLLVVRVWKDNRITAADWQWAMRIPDVMRNKTDNLPELGKYNFGQKQLTRTLLLCILLLLGSGFLIWQPWFAPEFTVPLRRQAVVIHAVAAFVAMAGIIVHVYAAYWTRGSIRGMTRGYVSAAWAKHHHAAWYREVVDKQ